MSLHDLFRDHNSHWSTLPVLAYRGLYSLFGLHTYAPYQLLVVVLHLGAAVMLRFIMRRAGVDPWIATAAAGAVVLLGAAEDNILWAFQIGFVGSLVLGMGHLVLADHVGPIDRRDGWGLGLGALCLMTSGQAPPLIAAVGVVCLLRGRPRAAAFHTVPLAVAYVVWRLVTRVETVIGIEGEPFTVEEYLTWMADAGRALFEALGHGSLGALVLVVILVAGLAVAWRDERRGLFARAAVPIAMVLAGALSMSVAAPSRFFLGDHPATAGRYLGVIAVLSLPLLAVAGDALVRQRRALLPLVVGVFVVPLVFNATDFGDDFVNREFFDRQRISTVRMAEHPLTRQAQPWVLPNVSLLFGQPDMTAGWLVTASENGELPVVSEPLDPLLEGLLPIQLGVATLDPDEEVERVHLTCEDHTEPVAKDPALGDRWFLETPAAVAVRGEGGTPASLWHHQGEGAVEITLPDLRLLVGPAAGEEQVRICW